MVVDIVASHLRLADRRVVKDMELGEELQHQAKEMLVALPRYRLRKMLVVVVVKAELHPLLMVPLARSAVQVVLDKHIVSQVLQYIMVVVVVVVQATKVAVAAQTVVQAETEVVVQVALLIVLETAPARTELQILVVEVEVLAALLEALIRLDNLAAMAAPAL